MSGLLPTQPEKTGESEIVDVETEGSTVSKNTTISNQSSNSLQNSQSQQLFSNSSNIMLPSLTNHPSPVLSNIFNVNPAILLQTLNTIQILNQQKITSSILHAQNQINLSRPILPTHKPKKSTTSSSRPKRQFICRFCQREFTKSYRKRK